jgi:hypothetical protein
MCLVHSELVLLAVRTVSSSQALVAHTSNPSYSGGRDQEDCNLKPVWANSSQDTILEKPFTRKGLVEWLKVKALSSRLRTTKKQTSN